MEPQTNFLFPAVPWLSPAHPKLLEKYPFNKGLGMLKQVATQPLQTLINTPELLGPRTKGVGERPRGEASCELLGHQWIAGEYLSF